MATRNIIPRVTGEGSLGRDDRRWGSAYINSIYSTNISVSSLKVTTLNASQIIGNISSADAASKDGSGNVITDTYATKNNLQSTNNRVITLEDDNTANKANIGKLQTAVATLQTYLGLDNDGDLTLV